MPRKPAIAKETAAPAKPVRATKSSTTRVKAAQHSKVVPVAEKTGAEKTGAEKTGAEKTGAEKIEELVVSAVPVAAPESAHEAIAKIAYGYWESRGCQGGTEIDDWVRAEREYRLRTGVAEARAAASGL